MVLETIKDGQPLATSKPKALILVADGSEEIEFVTPYDGM
jgi:hypothetical protein